METTEIIEEMVLAETPAILVDQLTKRGRGRPRKYPVGHKYQQGRRNGVEITARLTKDLRRKLEQHRQSRRQSITTVVALALESYLRQVSQ